MKHHRINYTIQIGALGEFLKLRVPDTLILDVVWKPANQTRLRKPF